MFDAARPLLLATLLPLLFAACGKVPTPAEEVRPVRYTVVGDDAAQPSERFAGEIRARQETKLGFRVAGKVVEKLVNAGEHVKKGQAIARLDAHDYALDLSAKRAQLAAAEHDLAQKEADLRRYQELLAKNFISQAQVDQQRNAVSAAHAQLTAARASADASSNQTGYATLTAVADGIVTDISAEPGLVVSAGQPVATLAADGAREAAIAVPENKLAALRTAKSFTVTLWAANKHYTGHLRELAGAADPATRTYAARIALDNPDDAVKLGMTTSVGLPNANAGEQIRLPLTALLDEQGKHYVWVIDPASRKVGRKPVSVAAVGTDWVAVSGGIVRGQQVVTAGVHLLRDGQRVSLLKESAA
ncbi:efflux RND transporter periplasmic adaptor subunit [Crenobacter sp. SG2305]|uniref:efflux RND transporter periplasmic adaptor subunit n=1 Tax=Crenobacter oryzisoli TaxID=3056844 RepID=UPI0025AAB8EF|nr:efflux RND transporter periplasmic adaptor subunit [Crenobacter sp. SG2305]MDN0082700.1 efflux RND transporter periplasmic adaptor subunit [Crenobacter sp. SG2305]